MHCTERLREPPAPKEVTSCLALTNPCVLCGLTFDVRGWPQASPLDGGVRPQVCRSTLTFARIQTYFTHCCKTAWKAAFELLNSSALENSTIARSLPNHLSNLAGSSMATPPEGN